VDGESGGKVIPEGYMVGPDGALRACNALEDFEQGEAASVAENHHLPEEYG
jgi:hypothetical protein